MLEKVKKFYNNNKRITNIAIIAIICLAAIKYGSVFLQKGIYFADNFYSQQVIGYTNVYKQSTEDYFAVSNTGYKYRLTVKTPKDTGIIEVERSNYNNLCTITYPDGTVFKGNYKNGYFYNDDGSLNTDVMLSRSIAFSGDVLDMPFNERYSEVFVISTALGENVVIRGNIKLAVIGVLLLIASVLQFKFPKKLSLFSSRRKLNSSLDELELSDEYLKFNKIGCAALLMISLICFIAAVI